MFKEAKGFFITFEGADGVGKTTQAALLADYLRANGWDTVTAREPGGTVPGERVRAVLLDPDCEMAARTEALLYLAARAELVDKVVGPALRAGKVVISDRFSDSTLVYQGIGRGLPADKLAAINDFAAAGLRPDLTILLDAPLESLLARVNRRGAADRMEKMGASFQEAVRRGFLALAGGQPDRMAIVGAAGKIDDIQDEIREIVCGRLSGGRSEGAVTARRTI